MRLVGGASFRREYAPRRLPSGAASLHRVHADSHLLAATWGDEIALRQDLQRVDFGDKAEFVQVFVRAITRTFTDASPAELAKPSSAVLPRPRR